MAVIAQTEVKCDYQNVANTLYDLVIARWDKEKSVLSLYASDYERMRWSGWKVWAMTSSCSAVTPSSTF